MTTTLDKLILRSFKAFEATTEVRLKPFSVLVGPNGSGKSNFISFFKMLSWMTPGNLQVYVAKSGGRNRVINAAA